jgi:hypothetical protein
MKRLLTLVFAGLCCLTTHSVAQAQEQPSPQPPSLQMGLNGLTFRPGNLDAELIMQIVAEKQEEVKKRAIKNGLLRQVNNAGGTVYIFADNVLNAIINERDNAVRTRTILENAVNLTFAMALTQYVRNKPATTFNKLIIGPDGSNLRQRGVAGIRAGKTRQTTQTADLSFEPTINLKPAQSEAFFYLLDLVSESIRNNERLNALGLMRMNYPGSWQMLNLYLNDTSIIRQAESQRIRSAVDAQLNQLLDNIGFITSQLEEGRFSFPARSIFYLAIDRKNLNINQFHAELTGAIGAVETLMIPDSTKLGLAFQKAHGEALAQYWAYLRKIEAIPADKLTLTQLSDILYHLTVDVDPQFEQVTALANATKQLHRHTQALKQLILGGVATSGVTSTDDASFLRLVAKLYQFRKAKTYSDYLNILTDLPTLINDPQVRSTLNTLLTFIKNYVVIKKDAQDKELVEIDVESLLVMLQQYSQNRPRTVQFMFTAGVNTAYGNTPLAPGDTLRNFAFVGEKIGLKFRLKDWHYLRSFNKYQTFYRYAGHRRTVTRLQPPQEPLVSNLHLLLYGSGIAYNLVNSSNKTNFRQPLLGLGLGMTFMNSLDLSLSTSFAQKAGQTLNENFSRPFINFGLDILFSEYLDRLTKKRNTVKVTKKE